MVQRAEAKGQQTQVNSMVHKSQCFVADDAGEEAVRSAFINVDQAGIGSLTEHQFEAALRQAGIELTRHQIISLHRRLAKDGKVQVEDVLRVLI